MGPPAAILLPQPPAVNSRPGLESREHTRRLSRGQPIPGTGGSPACPIRRRPSVSPPLHRPREVHPETSSPSRGGHPGGAPVHALRKARADRRETSRRPGSRVGMGAPTPYGVNAPERGFSGLGAGLAGDRPKGRHTAAESGTSGPRRGAGVITHRRGSRGGHPGEAPVHALRKARADRRETSRRPGSRVGMGAPTPYGVNAPE
jgi:hypothetical protein